MATNYKVLGQASTGETQINVINKAVSNNVVTLTTDGDHNIVFGQQFSVAEGIQYTAVSNSETANNVATLTIGSHRISVGQTITVTMDSTPYDTYYDGSHIVTAVTSTSVSFTVSDTTLDPAASTGTVEYLDTAFNGTFVVDSIPTTDTFTYITVSADLDSTAVTPFPITYMPWKVLYTCPSGTSAIVSKIFICNQSEVPTTYQIAVSNTFDLENKHLMFYNDVLDPFDTLVISGGIVLDEVTKYLLIAADVENVSISVFGMEVT